MDPTRVVCAGVTRPGRAIRDRPTPKAEELGPLLLGSPQSALDEDSLRARRRNTAIWPQATVLSGQQRLLIVRLQPPAIPSAAIALMLTS